MKYLQNQKGSALVMSAFITVALLIFSGIVVDLGNAYFIRTKMQSAADAAAGAGGLKLPDTSAATSAANDSIVSNLGKNGVADPKVAPIIDFAVDAGANPGGASEINVRLTQNVPTNFMKLIGIQTVAVAVLAEGISSGGGGPFGYGIFSANSTTLNLNYADYKGAIYSGGNINFNGGGIKVEGNVVAKGSVSGYPGNGNTVTGSVAANDTKSYDMPDYTSKITVTTYDAGGKAYNLNGAVTGNTYIRNGSLNIGGTGTTTFANTEVIEADGDITINSGNVTLSGSNQVVIYSRTGNITFNGGGGNWNQGTVVAYAPNGTVDSGGGSTPFRSIVAQYVNIYGGSINVDTTKPITALPVGGHVKLVK